MLFFLLLILIIIMCENYFFLTWYAFIMNAVQRHWAILLLTFICKVVFYARKICLRQRTFRFVITFINSFCKMLPIVHYRFIQRQGHATRLNVMTLTSRYVRGHSFNVMVSDIYSSVLSAVQCVNTQIVFQTRSIENSSSHFKEKSNIHVIHVFG